MHFFHGKKFFGLRHHKTTSWFRMHQRVHPWWRSKACEFTHNWYLFRELPRLPWVNSLMHDVSGNEYKNYCTSLHFHKSNAACFSRVPRTASSLMVKEDKPPKWEPGYEQIRGHYPVYHGYLCRAQQITKSDPLKFTQKQWGITAMLLLPSCIPLYPLPLL